jgi:uncharacterized protein YggT (Ycf19 family)
MNMTYYFFQTVLIFLRVMRGALFVYVILSWIAPRTPLFGFVARFVEPYLRPFRALYLKLLGRRALPIDLSVFLAFIGLEVIQHFLVRLYIALL